MRWNWQHKDWPNFKYEVANLLEFEREFLTRTGVLSGSLKHVMVKEYEELSIDLLSVEAHKSSLIEGELLNRESVQSSIRKAFGIQVPQQAASPSESGMAELMVDNYQHFAAPLSHELLFRWHSMLMRGQTHLTWMGAYREHEDPMRVISGPTHREIVHFEAPPSTSVPKEMAQFITWFNASENSMGLAMPLVRAGLAHLWFESIHPFEDGNGRLGRTLSEKVLSQHLGRPTLMALSHVIEAKKKQYYTELHRASIDLEVHDWLHYFSETILEAVSCSQTLVDFLIAKAKFFQAFGDQLNERQHKAIFRMFKEGPDGFVGGLSSNNYVTITKASPATATRDLQKLVSMGALTKTGELKGTRYFLKLVTSN